MALLGVCFLGFPWGSLDTYGMYTYGIYTYGMYTYGMYTYGIRDAAGFSNPGGLAVMWWA